MGNGRYVLDQLDGHTGRLQSRNCTLTSRTRTLHTYFQFFHTKLGRLLSGLLSGTLAGKWSTLATPFETARSGTRPTQRISLGVGDRDRGVVERGFHVSQRNRDVTTQFLFRGRRLLFL